MPTKLLQISGLVKDYTRSGLSDKYCNTYLGQFELRWSFSLWLLLLTLTLLLDFLYSDIGVSVCTRHHLSFVEMIGFRMLNSTREEVDYNDKVSVSRVLDSRPKLAKRVNPSRRLCICFP